MYVQESYGKNVKSLTKAQEDSVHCISVTYQFDPLRVEACQIGQAWLPFSECVFATAYDFLSFMCLDMVSKLAVLLPS